MKLLRFGESGKEKPGVLIGEEIVDVSSFGEDFGEDFFANDGLNRLSAWLGKNSNVPKAEKNVRIGTPFTRPSKIICIGLNYSDHAKETTHRTNYFFQIYFGIDWTQRCACNSAGQCKNRLGGRTGSCNWQESKLC